MTIEIWGLTYTVDCDFCSYSEDTHFDLADGFMAVVDYIKEEGWRIFKKHGDWYHKCPCCIENDVEEEFK